MHFIFGWHLHPSDPGAQSVISTEPEAPSGITHIPFSQTPLAQSGAVSQVVFGSGTLGMQSPPSHLPLSQSLASAQREPAGEPELTLPSPPELVEPPLDVELLPPRANPSEPPSPEP